MNIEYSYRVRYGEEPTHMNTKPKITDNPNVVQAWSEGKNARNHRCSLRACDGELFSYQLKIGHRTPTGACIVADFAANDDSCHWEATPVHVGYAKLAADLVMHPLVWESSPFSGDGLPF
jgi:hypothetical protein